MGQRTPVDPNAVPYSGAPDNGGIPRHGVPGTYSGPTLDDVCGEASPNLSARQIEDLADEARSGQDLAANGYRVEALPYGSGAPSP
jgi:hypothetical protein